MMSSLLPRILRSTLSAGALLGMLAAPALAAGGSPGSSEPLKLVTTMAPPGVPPATGSWSFDISWTDHQGNYYLADRGTKGLDIFDKNNQFVKTIGGFTGAVLKNGKVDNDHSGPNGVLVIESRHEAWMGDGDSTIKVVDLNAGRVVASIPNGGKARA